MIVSNTAYITIFCKTENHINLHVLSYGTQMLCYKYVYRKDTYIALLKYINFFTCTDSGNTNMYIKKFSCFKRNQTMNPPFIYSIHIKIIPGTSKFCHVLQIIN